MCSQENYIDRLVLSVNFSNCQFGFPVLEYYLVVQVDLHIWLTLIVKQKCGNIYLLSFGGNYCHAP
jgi:hypothetical protein